MGEKQTERELPAEAGAEGASLVSGDVGDKQPEVRKEETQAALVTRRGFLGYAAGAIASFIGIVAGVPMVGYLAGAFQAKGLSQWVRLGRLEQFPEGTPQPVEVTLARQDGWVEVREARSAWVVREGEKVVTFNGRCTHLGCAYSWQSTGSQADHFFCPCHEGQYDRAGFVVGGPPPRPLDRLETKITDGDLWAQYVDFRPGVPDKVAQ